MHLRNRLITSAAGALVLMLLAWDGRLEMLRAQTQRTPPAVGAEQKATPPAQLPADVDVNDPALPIWLRGVAPVPPTADIPPTPKPEVNATVTKDRDGFRIRKEVDEVTLHATVVDSRLHLVTTLRASDFQVFEDDQPQRVTVFSHEDIPVSLGILVDNSGSMREKRAAVTKAVINLVKASNPQDEVFIVNFNDEPWLDQDYTNDVPLLREALDRVDSRGATALYDAVIAAATHLAKGARREKKVLLAVTDGEDNESNNSLEQAIRAVQDDNGPVVYTIGILGKEGRERRAKRALMELAGQTGGSAYFPKNLTEVDEVSQAVAHDIRNQYTIAYKPTNPQTNGGYRRIKVLARGSGFHDLQVRTRSGYFAGQQKSK
ncbi:MAG TPA: VWA domain-containing protein [Candidatus Saccharimonadales bacterium]|jgi:Ca-activated chloride channel family protein|nr:VWA domain-containing protein [Candidatus Saccharimonadales bacterium]